ncbi:MAG: hypothetical protein IIB57_04515, partial [Planctomycetes bacterium]|nr:hypothetical protein [Planctomycetota bacterium]
MKTCHLTSITVSVFLVALFTLTAGTSALAQSPAFKPSTAHSEAVPADGMGLKGKKALISAEAKAAGQVRGDGPATCSGDATQLLFPLDGSYSPVNFCALPLTPGYDQAQCTGIPPDQHND